MNGREARRAAVPIPLPILAPGATLAGMFHPADGPTAALIVAGAPQTRAGAHRGFVDLARALAAAGVPVLRFDRRGLGDSDGDDPGFYAIAPDITAALAALRQACPDAGRVIGIGLCDGAAALALAPAGFDALLLLNPWTRDECAAATMPPRAAIARRYRNRLGDPASWKRLLAGGMDLRKALRGVFRLARRDAASIIAGGIAAGLVGFAGPVRIVLAERDNTAQAFASIWRTRLFAAARARPGTRLDWVADATHTFAGEAAAALLAEASVDFALTCFVWSAGD